MKKERRVVINVQKNQRKVKSYGCVADLSGDFSNMKSRKGTIEDISSLKSGRGTRKEPQRMWGSGS